MDHRVGVGKLQDLALSTKRRDEARRPNRIEQRRGVALPSLKLSSEPSGRLKRRILSVRVDGVELS